MAKTLRREKALVRSILEGMASPAAVYEVNQYPYPHPSTQEALRSDLVQIGDDFKKVMKRGNAEAAA